MDVAIDFWLRQSWEWILESICNTYSSLWVNNVSFFVKFLFLFFQYRLSRASSISMGSVTSFDDLAEVSKDPPPKRPIRRKKPSNSGSAGSSSKMSISSSDQPQKVQPKVNRNSLRRSKRRSLKKQQQRKMKNNVNHWKKSEEESSTYSTDNSDIEDSDKFKASNGDIYTKVAMPRSRSFMKINNSQGGGGNHNYNLQDLFKELKDQVNFRIRLSKLFE